MGDIVVDHFLETLHQLLSNSNLDFHEQVKNQLQNLYEEMEYLREFLKMLTDKKRNKHPEVMKLVMQIRDVTYDADNIVDLFVPLVSKADHPSDSLREFPDHLFLDLEGVEKVIKNLMDEVKQIYDENMYDINGVATERLEHSSNRNGGSSGSTGGWNPCRGVKDEVVIGFEDHIKRLVEEYLNNKWHQEFVIICINGAAGSGKTTLAREVYYHPLIRKNFEIHAWVVVSQDYTKRDLLLGILKSACPENYDHYEKSDDDVLGEELFKSLKGKRCLIVMDDMWDNQAWDDISTSLPRENTGSQVIFTTREVQHVSDAFMYVYDIGRLSEICSWELLEKKVFGNKCCPPDLVEIGKQIAEKCDGLPLVINATAEILENGEKTLNAWEKMAKNFGSIIAKNHEGCMKRLELSYNHLSRSLKACFLYIGAYPKDYEIPFRELVWLWIAEGFIQQNGEGESLEDIAKSYLNSLIVRNLITVTWKTGSNSINGIPEACRIHELFRELCLEKAQEDNFFVQIDGDDSSAFSATNKHSRLFIFRQFFNEFFFSEPYPQNLRSFLCLGSRHTRIELHISFFAETFELLRVFSFSPDECQGEILIGKLVHLRYLALQLSENADFRFPFHLVKLETLIVQTSCFKDIKLSNDILKMVKLRHLYSQQGMFTYHVSCVEDEWNTLDGLQTLHKMCICKYCLRFLEKTPNLRELGLVRDPDTKGDDIVMLSDLEFLEQLEILYVKSTSVARTGLKLPSTLTNLTLCDTQLQWDELSKILQTLWRLQFLTLLKDACSGPVWDTSELKIKLYQLEYLRLRDLDINEWRASQDCFQSLSVLVIQDCRKLKGIPIEFSNHCELNEIEVERSSRSAEESARRIKEETEKKEFSKFYHFNVRLTLSCNSW